MAQNTAQCSPMQENFQKNLYVRILTDWRKYAQETTYDRQLSADISACEKELDKIESELQVICRQHEEESKVSTQREFNSARVRNDAYGLAGATSNQAGENSKINQFLNFFVEVQNNAALSSTLS